MQSQMNEIFGNVRHHNGQTKLQNPWQASDQCLKSRNPEIFRGLVAGNKTRNDKICSGRWVDMKYTTSKVHSFRNVPCFGY